MHSKGIYLDELDPNDGRELKPILPDCGTFCDVALADIEAHKLKDVIAGKISIYDAA